VSHTDVASVSPDMHRFEKVSRWRGRPSAFRASRPQPPSVARCHDLPNSPPSCANTVALLLDKACNAAYLLAYRSASISEVSPDSSQHQGRARSDRQAWPRRAASLGQGASQGHGTPVGVCTGVGPVGSIETSTRGLEEGSGTGGYPQGDHHGSLKDLL
jgi:hypothetical protein